jgi:hypothetical protein
MQKNTVPCRLTLCRRARTHNPSFFQQVVYGVDSLLAYTPKFTPPGSLRPLLSPGLKEGGGARARVGEGGPDALGPSRGTPSPPAAATPGLFIRKVPRAPIGPSPECQRESRLAIGPAHVRP